MNIRVVSNLGSPQPQDVKENRAPRDYSSVAYHFTEPQELLMEKTSCFAIALYRYLARIGKKPSSLLFIGTHGSIWDSLLWQEPSILENDKGLFSFSEELHTSILGQNVTQEQLNALSSYLTKILNMSISCKLIDSCQSEESQEQYIKYVLDQEIQRGDHLYLDLTHAYRHFSIMLMQAALLAEQSKQIHIKGAFYGAFEMRAGRDAPVPVVSLGNSLLLSQQELIAIQTWRKTGNPHLLSLAIPEESPISEPFEKYAYAWSINNHKLMDTALHRCMQAIQKLPRGLWRDSLVDTLQQQQAHQQEAIYRSVERNIKCKDYLRAITELYEDSIQVIFDTTPGLSQQQDADRQASSILYDKLRDTWNSIRKLRNAITHGEFDANDSVERLLAGPEDRLQQTLRNLHSNAKQILLPLI